MHGDPFWARHSWRLPPRARGLGAKVKPLPRPWVLTSKEPDKSTKKEGKKFSSWLSVVNYKLAFSPSILKTRRVVQAAMLTVCIRRCHHMGLEKLVALMSPCTCRRQFALLASSLHRNKHSLARLSRWNQIWCQRSSELKVIPTRFDAVPV